MCFTFVYSINVSGVTAKDGRTVTVPSTAAAYEHIRNALREMPRHAIALVEDGHAGIQEYYTLNGQRKLERSSALEFNYGKEYEL